MPRCIRLEPHLTRDELHNRYRQAGDAVERSHWHFLWLLASGLTATAVAAVTGYSAYWIGQIARRYNTEGPDGVLDRRHTLCAGRPDLPASQLAELGAAVAGPHPEGDRWCGRTVAEWLTERLGRQVGRHLGWRYLRRLGARWLKPRPRHVPADLQAQAEFKAHLRHLLRQVATAFPPASVELWAVDEHRIGLKPILRKVWTLPTLPGQRPIAPVEHRYDIRHLALSPHGYPRDANEDRARCSRCRHPERASGGTGGANGHTTWTLVVGFPVETGGQRCGAVYPSLARLGAGRPPPVSRWRWPFAWGWGVQINRGLLATGAGAPVGPAWHTGVEIASVQGSGIGCHWTGPRESLSRATRS